MKITRAVVEQMAELSRLSLSDAQARRLEQELGTVIGYMEILNTADLSAWTEKADACSVAMLREDAVAPSYPRAELLANAPACTEQAFTVPKAVEE